MTGKTHASCGLLIGAYIAKDYGISFDSVLILTSSVLGSIVPDICHTRSYIGRRIPLLSFIINLIFGHRTFTHSILFVVLNYLILSFIDVPNIYVLAYLLGVISHIILDMMTASGVHLFYPIKTNIALPLNIKTGGIVDYALFFLFVGTIYVIYR